MHLFGAIVEERLHIVLQLCTANDRVVTEHHALVLQQRRVGNEFHLCHQCTALLIAGCERTGPCRCVFQHRPFIRHAFTFGISQRHSDARIRHTADTVHFGIVQLTHLLTVCLTHSLYVDAVIVGGGESVIHPQERADLFPLKGFLQHLECIGRQEHDLSRAEVSLTVEVQVREARRLTRHGIRPLLLTDDDRCTAEEVTGSDNTFLRQYQHRARTLDFLIDEVNALHKGATHVDEQRHELRLVDVVGR